MIMTRRSAILLFWATLLPAFGGTLVGHVRDRNWYARYSTNPPGVGYYEYGVNANPANSSAGAGRAATDVYGAFQMPNLPAGAYTVASWDVWWRSAFAFGVAVPESGNSDGADLRLGATMWGYPAFWDTTGYQEFGQTFVATGPITMIYLRNPLIDASPTLTLTVHDGGPAGAQIGVSRALPKDLDIRVIYGYGEMPTAKGRQYYVKIRSSGGGAVLSQMDPRPDFSDPMPGGWLYLGNGTTVTPYPDRDLGITIMSDDDGLITNLHTRQSGTHVDGSSVGQTFVARGVSLICAAFWLADPTDPIYVVRVYQNGPGGAPVGTAKRGRPSRPGADPEMLVTWPPGECPITPGQTYYVEVTKDGGGVFTVANVNRTDPFPYGQAYLNGSLLAGSDLAGTLMEEESPGSAARPTVQFVTDPTIVESRRGSNQMTIAWATDVLSDSEVAYVADYPPYVFTNCADVLVTNHSVTLSNLQSHTLYHFQARSAAANYKDGLSRDFVGCTRPASSNLLVNGSFEEGSGPSPRSVIPGWNKTGIDLRASDGGWFFGLKPTNGNWFCQGALNGDTSDGYIFQRVTGVTPGDDYSFSAWVLTAHREDVGHPSTWKYDVWDRDGRLIHMRLGIDPTGATDPTASTVQWTPRMYSHLRYTQLAKTAFAQSNAITVFVRMQGKGGDWHLYGVDDCVLTHEDIPLRFAPSHALSSNRFEMTLLGKANRTNQLEVSTNLVDWRAGNVLFNRTGGVQIITGALTNVPARFFRARPR